MIKFLLIFIFSISILFALISIGIVFYHFKRFGIKGDIEAEKIFKIFSIGSLVLIFQVLLFFILIFSKK